MSNYEKFIADVVPEGPFRTAAFRLYDDMFICRCLMRHTDGIGEFDAERPGHVAILLGFMAHVRQLRVDESGRSDQ